MRADSEYFLFDVQIVNWIRALVGVCSWLQHTLGQMLTLTVEGSVVQSAYHTALLRW